jgi:predicted Zn-dependent peptidase
MATDPEDVNLALETTKKEIEKIRKGGLSRSELDEAREHLIGGIHLSSESADSRMMRIARSELAHERYVSDEELVSSLERVTLDEVIGICDEIFGNGNACLVTLGPLEEEALDQRWIP